MHDQANALRGLMEHRSKTLAGTFAHSGREGQGRTVAITSGKGGVGKSNVALNLAIALARASQSVLLLDVNFGVGTIELLCGLNSPWSLSHVLAGQMSLEEILVEGPEGIRILPGAGSLGESSYEPAAIEEVSKQLANLRRQFQFMILDLGAGLSRLMDRFLTALDLALMVTTTEPPSLAEAYALIKSVSKTMPLSWEVLINQAASAKEAESVFHRLSHTTRAFLQKELAFAGWVPQDPHVPQAVLARSPFVLEHPHSRASKSIRQLAHRLLDPKVHSHAVTKISHSHEVRRSPEASPPIAAW